MPYRQICHEHCPKGGGSRAALAVLVLIVVIAAAGPVASAAADMLRIVVGILEIACIVVASVAVLGVAGWAASRVYARQHRAALETQAWPARIAARRPTAVEASRDRTAELELQLAEARAQLAAPQQHLHLHGLDAEQLAAIIIRQHNLVLPATEEDHRP